MYAACVGISWTPRGKCPRVLSRPLWCSATNTREKRWLTHAACTALTANDEEKQPYIDFSALSDPAWSQRPCMVTGHVDYSFRHVSHLHLPDRLLTTRAASLVDLTSSSSSSRRADGSSCPASSLALEPARTQLLNSTQHQSDWARTKTKFLSEASFWESPMD